MSHGLMMTYLKVSKIGRNKALKHHMISLGMMITRYIGIMCNVRLTRQKRTILRINSEKTLKQIGSSKKTKTKSSDIV
jgi:hypothetical protein